MGRRLQHRRGLHARRRFLGRCIVAVTVRLCFRRWENLALAGRLVRDVVQLAERCAHFPLLIREDVSRWILFAKLVLVGQRQVGHLVVAMVVGARLVAFLAGRARALALLVRLGSGPDLLRLSLLRYLLQLLLVLLDFLLKQLLVGLDLLELVLHVEQVAVLVKKLLAFAASLPGDVPWVLLWQVSGRLAALNLHGAGRWVPCCIAHRLSPVSVLVAH